MSQQPFKLSATLVGHSQDVKAVKFVNPSSIYSCARDTTARVWNRDPELNTSNQGWHEKSLYQNSNPGFLNAVERIVIEGEDHIITAGQDALIQIWPLSPKPDESYGPRFVLASHTSNVCCLSITASPANPSTILSGSWDCTAIIWRQNTAVHTLTGHTAAVWAVLGLEDSSDSVLTGAADNLIMLWREGKQLLTFKGHTQAVRALVKIPFSPQLFASAGNDATVRLWDLSGQSIKVLDGHDSFIYSLSCLPTGELVSSGEDRTVRIWDPKSGRLTQTVTVPAISVWTVSACSENGDFACGSSDNMIRVFTRSTDRLASPDELSAFEESVRTSSVPSATVGDIKKSDIPPVHVILARRGKKEGEVAMGKNELTGAVEAYQWDGIKGDWTMVGTVVDGIGSSRKQLYEGKEYDYVFDVDIKDGAPPIKLPYNVSDNPYTVAQKWLAKNELPDSYVDQIVEFIDKNTAGVSIGNQTSGADPFTGAGSYRPGQASANTSSVGSDPFTGAGSYRPGVQPTNPQIFGGDPFTGASGYRPGDSGGPSKDLRLSLLPHKTMLTFPPANLNFSAVLGKVKEFNSELAGSGTELTLNQLAALTEVTDCLSKPAKSPPEGGIKVLQKMALDWPVDKKFPAMDLIRIMAMSTFPTDILPTLLKILGLTPSSPSTEINLTLSLRAINNGFSSAPTQSRADLARKVFDIISDEGGLKSSRLTTKNSKVALATVLLNLSILVVIGTLDHEFGAKLLRPTSNLIGAELEEEVLYRSLVALGNLIYSRVNAKKKIADQEKTEITNCLKHIKLNDSSDRLRDVITELNTLVN